MAGQPHTEVDELYQLYIDGMFAVSVYEELASSEDFVAGLGGVNRIDGRQVWMERPFVMII
jgi:hypothetical protein